MKKRKFFDTEMREINFGSSNNILDSIENENKSEKEIIGNSDVGGNGGNEFRVQSHNDSERKI